MATQNTRQYMERSRSFRNGNMERLANGLGWFSIGLGFIELAAPEAVAEMIGIKDKSRIRTLLRLYGLREIAAGVGILTESKPAGWLWGRVAGDMVDLASLGMAMSSNDSNRARVGAAATAVLAVTALDVYCGQRMSGRSSGDGRIRATKSITIDRSPEELYAFWRNFENLPTFMDHLKSVQVTGGRRSHWKAKGPAGTTVEWDSELIIDRPNAMMAWRSLPGSDIRNSGSVQFERATGGRGTVVRVKMEYAPPGGTLGANIAKLFGSEPGQQVEKALRLLKQIMETGDIVRSDAGIHSGLRMHAAKPPADAERFRPSVVREHDDNIAADAAINI